MADYDSFQPNLRPWLKAVWKGRSGIAAGVRKKGRTEGAWLVYDLYNDPHNQTSNHFKLFLECISEFQDEYAVSVFPQGGKVVDTDFYHMEPDGYDESKSKSRIYVSTKGQSKGDDTFMSQWANALCIAYKVLELRSTVTGFQKLKVTGPAMSANRHDNVVIWLTGQPAVEAFLVHMRTDEISQHFGNSTPPGTKQVMPGLAWANEPPTTSPSHKLSTLWGSVQHSFGSYLAGCIFLGLERTWNKTESDFLDAVLKMFEMANVDPENAQSVGVSHSKFQHDQTVTNIKALTAGLGSGPDSTKPFVVPSQLDALKSDQVVL